MSSLPSAMPSIWNSTPATPTLSVAVALTVIVPVRPVARFAGAASVAFGACVSLPDAGATSIVRAVLVELSPSSSVARARSVWVPAVDGVQLRVYGALESVPITVLPSRNSTLAMLQGEGAEAFLAAEGVRHWCLR